MESLQGKLPTRQELSGWDETKYLTFLQFCQLFIVQTSKGSTIRVTKERWQETHSLPLESHQEFFYRHPETITPTMHKIIEPNVRFNWCLTKKSPIVSVIIPQRPVSLDEKLYTLATKSVDLCERIVSSISDEEIKQMSPKDRALFASRMQWVFESKKYMRTHPNTFRHIDLQTASIRELEADVLSYSTRKG
jgi:hypothetical protein